MHLFKNELTLKTAILLTHYSVVFFETYTTYFLFLAIKVIHNEDEGMKLYFSLILSVISEKLNTFHNPL